MINRPTPKISAQKSPRLTAVSANSNNSNETQLKINLSGRLRNIAIAAFGSLLAAIVLMALFQMTGGDAGKGFMNRLFILLGGNILGGGYIQVFTYFAFIWSMLESIRAIKKLKRERSTLNLGLLPTSEKHLFLAQDLRELYFTIQQFENESFPCQLTELIRKSCLKFRSSQSVPELIEIISMQIEIYKDKSESSQSIIRYLSWVIPSIGFIGTVLGISQALMIANSGDMDKITATLGVAFDTTLISLLLSIIVMWYFHSLQEETDRYHADLKDYILSNLVNKIEV